MPLTGELSAEHCPLPRGGCTSILGEHADAIRLIQRMRDASRQSEHGSVRHWFKPVGEVSADFFCTAEHPRFGWYGLMADVSGHGLVSSMFALHVPMLFRESVLLGMSLPAIYARIDEFLARQQIGGYFVSGFLVRVQEREIELINAGMPDAMLLTADGRLCEAFPSRQLPFGIAGNSENQVAVPQRYRLARDEHASLLLYSDGLSELGMLGGDAFGRDGILAKAEEGADRIFDKLLDKVGQSADEIHDDISISLISVPLRKRDPTTIDMEVEAASAAAEPFFQTKDVSTILRIVENLDQGLMLTDAEQRILYVNPSFTAITGYLPDEIIGQTPRLLSSGRHNAEFYRDMWQALQEDGNWFGEMWNRRKDGTLYLQWIDIQAIHDEHGRLTNYLATFTDILRKREQEDRLRFLALHDSLTGLANRILLTDRGRQAIYRADRAERSLAILFIDLDRFKTINDSLGHDIGDEVLVEVAQRLRRAVRSEDTLARFGGDQFVCLLPDIETRHDAQRVANKLLAALAVPVAVAGHQFKVGASIGVSAYPSDGAFFDDLIIRADRAMMRAKRAGGNLVKFFAAEMAAEMDRQLEMEARLDAALAAGDLVLYYQPKIDLLTHTIIGAEALVRWHDPQHGVVSPGVFIPVAERSDLIAKIGQWVLHEACQMLARRDGTLPAGFQLAVNISPKQFERGDLAEEVENTIKAAGIPPGRLQLEVTESVIIRETERVVKTLQRIAAMGISLALDDFGTGYSNLASLSRLPIDAFKLDQSFVRAVDTSAVNASIAKSVWHLAESLEKTLVAEGIETCDECCKIMSIGYRVAQGFRFGRPMPEKDFFALMESWNPEDYRCQTGSGN